MRPKSRSLYRPHFFVVVVVVCLVLAVGLVRFGVEHSRRSGVARCQATVHLDAILDNQRRFIAAEMTSLNASADWQRKFVLENGGEPIRNVVVTTWRSGSTFFNEILNNQPGNFDHYEPFHPYGEVNIDLGSDEHATRVLRSIIHCDYSLHIRPLFDTVLFNVNKHLSGLLPKHCFYSELIEPICRLFPYQSMKLIRVRLRHIAAVMRDYKNMRVFYLVRDPRASLNSRRDKDWCVSPTCLDPASLCADLVDDYRAALTLAVMYPTRFHVVRYEDLAADPRRVTREMFRDTGLVFDEGMEKFLARHTRENEGGSYSTHRNSSQVRFRWREVMDFKDVDDIQNVCLIAMKSWGYLPVRSKKDMRTFVPVRKWSLDSDT